MTKLVEVVSVGNELMIGKTVNTNAQWLAKRITSLGLSVSRITVVGDNVGEMAEALREAVHRNPHFIITTGGLGPTFDDKTLEGIGEAFGFELEVNEKALKMVKEKYVKYAQEMGREKFVLTPARVKMARIPEGAEPLPNPVGTAPAITVKCKEVTVFALPGVPSEMKAIFENSISPVLRRAAGNLAFFEASIYVSEIMESELAPLIDRVMHNLPLVYIKSHPKGTEKKPRIELHVSTKAGDVEAAKKLVHKALIQVSEIVESKGGKTETLRKRK